MTEEGVVQLIWVEKLMDLFYMLLSLTHICGGISFVLVFLSGFGFYIGFRLPLIGGIFTVFSFFAFDYCWKSDYNIVLFPQTENGRTVNLPGESQTLRNGKDVAAATGIIPLIKGQYDV